MRLQSKVLIILGVIWTVICLGLYIDSKVTLESDYKKLEQKLAANDINGVQKIIENKLSELRLYTTSWAFWDEAYDFMVSKSEKFIQSNFVSGTFTSSHINFFLFYDPQGTFFYGQAYDLTKKEFMPIPAGLLAYLNSNPDFVVHRDVNSPRVGILNIPEGKVVMSSLPVLTGDGKGPIRGSLLMGYFVNKEFFGEISDTAGMNITFIPLPITENNNMQKIAYTQLVAGDKYYLATKNVSTAYGFTLVKDIHNDPIGMLRMDIPRYVYNEGLITVYHYLAIVILLGLFTLLITMYLLKVLVLDRIIKVSDQVVDINSEAKFFNRIKISGNDEINVMVSTLNSMLELIELTQDQLKYRISRRTKDLEKLSTLNRNLFNEMSKQRSIETKLREDEKLLRKMAYYDTLTGLPNRAFFIELLQQAITNAEQYKNKVAVIFFDVDKFKKINDTYGHEFGDKFLKQVAYRLKKAIKDTDVVGRLAGDEFILFITNIKHKDMVDEIVTKIFNELTPTIIIDNISIDPTYSVGISIYDEDSKHIEELINQADLAMYYAKKQPGNSYRYYGAIENIRSNPLTY